MNEASLAAGSFLSGAGANGLHVTQMPLASATVCVAIMKLPYVQVSIHAVCPLGMPAFVACNSSSIQDAFGGRRYH